MAKNFRFALIIILIILAPLSARADDGVTLEEIIKSLPSSILLGDIADCLSGNAGGCAEIIGQVRYTTGGYCAAESPLFNPSCIVHRLAPEGDVIYDCNHDGVPDADWGDFNCWLHMEMHSSLYIRYLDEECQYQVENLSYDIDQWVHIPSGEISDTQPVLEDWVALEESSETIPVRVGSIDPAKCKHCVDTEEAISVPLEESKY